MLLNDWRDAAYEALVLASCAALAIDPESVKAKLFFRRAKPNGESQPAPGGQIDACYLDVRARVSGIGQHEEYLHPHDGKARIEAATSAECLFVFYGPNADKYATALRVHIHRDTGVIADGEEYPNPRDILRDAGITPQLVQPTISVLPELTEAGDWLNRADFLYQFNISSTIELDVPTVASAPDINIKRSE